MGRLDDYFKTYSNKINNVMDMLNNFENNNQQFIDNTKEVANTNLPMDIKIQDEAVVIDEESQRKEDIKKRKADSDKMILNNSSSQYSKIEIDPNIFNKDFGTEGMVQGLIYSEILGRPRCKKRRIRG